eukprot:COSAG01_NODE_36769_length_512_cov_12.447942_1_plen_105_part_01
MVSPVVPFADPLSCMLLPRGMIGPWFHFGEALMQCLPPGKRTEVNLQWFKTLVSKHGARSSSVLDLAIDVEIDVHKLRPWKQTGKVVDSTCTQTEALLRADYRCV